MHANSIGDLGTGSSGSTAEIVLWSEGKGRGVTRPTRTRTRSFSVSFRVATPILLFLAAVGVRMLSWHSVFQKNGVIPNGNDAYYHFRRIRYSIDHFPKVLDFDPLINFPHGAQPIWSPSFDWLMAAWLRGVPGIERTDQLERFAVLVPPIVGGLTVLVVYALGLRFFSRPVAIMAAASMAILPAHSIYSRLGAVDHHFLVAAVVAVMLMLAMALFREDTGAAPAQGHDPRIGSSVALGLSIAAAVLVWPGSLLHVGVLQIAMVVRLLSVAELESARRWALRFSIVHGVAALAVYPMCAGKEWALWGRFSPVVLSNFQPLYFFVASACFGILAVGWRTGWGSTTRRLSRGVSASALGSVLFVGLLVAIPDLRLAILDALSWFAKDEPFQAVVNESAPLFGGARGFARALAFLGPFVFVVPFSTAYFAWKLRHRPEILLLLGWGFALFLATLVQWRFMNSFSIAYCLLIGVTFESAYHSLRTRLAISGRTWATAATWALLVLLALVAFAVPLQSYRLHLENVARSLRGEEIIVVGALRHTRFIVDVAQFLRENSPPPEEARYSVLGPWGDGHILKYIGERAIVQDNFGDDVSPENFALAERYFSAKSESLGLEIVSPVSTRYVLVRSTGSGHSEGYARDSLFIRLYQSRGSRAKASVRLGALAEPFPALSRHRLVYQSASLRKGDSRPYCMLFEIVDGAELVGRADPGAIVRVSLDIFPRSGRGFIYTTSGVTDSAGRYSIRLPYPNEPFSPNVRSGASYRVRIGSESAEVVVSESAVLEGAEVAGPSFADG